MTLAFAFWGFLLSYGALMYWLSPRVATADGFYRGADAAGRPVGAWWLMSSVFISWIFAKSVTVAANLGASYGIVGGLAYATYWLSIPVAGVVIYWIRTRTGSDSLAGFLHSRYGRAAALAFTLAVLIRLYNEIWSNTAVVGSYFGDVGSWQFRAAAMVFTLITLAYSIKGGLRGSIITDALQAVLFVFFLGMVLFLILPADGVTPLWRSGDWRLDAGVDLLLVALLQVLSYPFHDPVLTDRGFLNSERAMLKAFCVAGVLGFACILLFSLVGVQATASGLDADGNVPAALGRASGIATFFFMTVVMISSAGSTLDSTFSSLAKAMAVDLRALFGRLPRPGKGTGAVFMILFAVLGNLPMFAGTDILKATTLSGTMVMGLAPAFLFWPWARDCRWSFHLSFWTGLAVGVAHSLGAIPPALAIGDGRYAALLGANVYGLALCTLLFWIPVAVKALRRRGHTDGIREELA